MYSPKFLMTWSSEFGAFQFKLLFLSSKVVDLFPISIHFLQRGSSPLDPSSLQRQRSQILQLVESMWVLTRHIEKHACLLRAGVSAIRDNFKSLDAGWVERGPPKRHFYRIESNSRARWQPRDLSTKSIENEKPKSYLWANCNSLTLYQSPSDLASPKPSQAKLFSEPTTRLKFHRESNFWLFL